MDDGDPRGRAISGLGGLDRAVYALFFGPRVPRGAALTYDRIAMAIGREPRTVSSACGRLVADGLLEVREERRTTRAAVGEAYALPADLAESPPPEPSALALFDASWMQAADPEAELLAQVERALLVIAINGQRPWIAAKEVYEYVGSWEAGLREPFGERYGVLARLGGARAPADIFEADLRPEPGSPSLGLEGFDFSAPTAPYQRGSSTSRRAAARAVPRLAGYRARVYRAVAAEPGRTRAEIGAMTGIWMSTLTPRIRELLAYGAIEERGSWTNPVTGKANALLYATVVAVELGPDGDGEDDAVYGIRREAFADIRAEIERNLARDLAATAALAVARSRWHLGRETYAAAQGADGQAARG